VRERGVERGTVVWDMKKVNHNGLNQMRQGEREGGKGAGVGCIGRERMPRMGEVLSTCAHHISAIGSGSTAIDDQGHDRVE
jgi:hypothetical protein